MEEIQEGALWDGDWGIWGVQKASNTRAGEGYTGIYMDVQVIHMELGVWKRELLETHRLFSAQDSHDELYTDYGVIPCAGGASSPAASRMSHVPGHGSTVAPSRTGTAL